MTKKHMRGTIVRVMVYNTPQNLDSVFMRKLNGAARLASTKLSIFVKALSSKPEGLSQRWIICHLISIQNVRIKYPKEGIKEDENQGALLSYLHNLGVALNFEKLDHYDTHVLNPVWLTKGVYKILNSDIAKDDKGTLKFAKLKHIQKIMN